MADPKDPFLARWSRRKRSPRRDRPAPDAEPERRDSDAVTAAPAEDTPPADVAEPGAAEPGATEPGVVAEELPDIDSLDKTSDFSVFLKEGVPEAIRRKALRRLWRLDPVLANLDGLNDYDEDFSVLGLVAGQLKTIYKVGKGYLDEDEAPGAEAPADPVPVAQTAGESRAAGKDDPGEGAGAATDARTESDSPEPESPEPESPEPESPEPESPETAGPGPAAADSTPRSGKSRSGKFSGRSARNRRWGGFAS